MRQEPHALAGAIHGFSHADVVHIPQAQAMKDEASTADFAGNFTENVELGLAGNRHGEHAHAVFIWGTHETNDSRRTLGGSGHGHRAKVDFVTWASAKQH